MGDNQCLSPYPSRDDLGANERLILIIAFAVLTPMTLILNGFLIIGLYKTKQHRNVFSRFIMVLSISDFCIGLFIQPVVIYLFIPGKEIAENCFASWYLTVVGYVFLNFSGLVIFMVSIDRFLRLRKSHRYAQKVTVQKVNYALVGAFLFCVVTSVAAYVSAIYDFFCIFNMVIITINFISAGGVLNFYFLAWRNVRKRISSLKNLSTRSSRYSSATQVDCVGTEGGGFRYDKSTAQSPKKSSLLNVLNKSKLSLASKKSRPLYDAAMTRTVAAILVCCCVTYPPYLIVSFYRSVMFTVEGHCNRKSHSTNVWFFWSFFLMFLNCVVNVILYSCHNRQLKDLLRNIRSYCGGRDDRQLKISSLDVTVTKECSRDYGNTNCVHVKEKPSFV